jgi:hypothetical protein
MQGSKAQVFAELRRSMTVTRAIQYRFAIGADGRLVDVMALTQESQSRRFVCIACGQRLVAHLKDDLRARHFAHYRKGECASRESYLHRAAKLAFLEAFRDRRAAGKPFTVRLPVVDTCNALEKSLGIRCALPQFREIDLAQWFDRAELEHRHDGFVADILLFGPRVASPLFVEIAVTHSCEVAKIASGHRILELRIQSDEQIAELRNAMVTVRTNDGHRAHNFRTKVLCHAFCAGECSRKVGVMVVHSTGRLRLFSMTARKALSFKPRTAVWQKILVNFEEAPPTADLEQLEYVGTDLPPGNSLFQRAAIAAITDGVTVRSCEVCRRQGSHSIFGRVWCFEYREDVHPSRAAECEHFRSVRSLQELGSVLRRNSQWNRRRSRYK